jgi:hypothetical protein
MIVRDKNKNKKKCVDTTDNKREKFGGKRKRHGVLSAAAQKLVNNHTLNSQVPG